MGKKHSYKLIRSAKQEAFHLGEKHPKIKISQVAKAKSAKDIHNLHRKAHGRKA